MKIANSSIEMSSTHVATQSREIYERLRTWTGKQRPDFEGANALAGRVLPESSRVAISDAARKAHADDGLAAKTAKSSAADDSESAVGSDPKFSLLASLIEALTGEKVHLLEFRMPAQDGPPTDIPDPNRRPESHFEYDRHEEYAESEETTFSAQGVVRTEDGKEIAFSVDLAMQRSYQESSDVSVRSDPPPKTKDPLILNFNGNAAQLTDMRFDFDLDNDGQTENIKLAGGGSGFLALDKNANGKIDNGSELFGATTGDGFDELAALDDDGNGWIDENDNAFKDLLLWSKNADGSDTLASLKDKGVGALYLGSVATPFDIKDGSNILQANIARSGVYLKENGGVGTMQKIDLAV